MKYFLGKVNTISGLFVGSHVNKSLKYFYFCCGFIRLFKMITFNKQIPLPDTWIRI